MKFYKRFPGDIQIKTGGLTLAEFGAYDRLLDHYYATEEPIAPDEVYSITRALSRADREAVDKVLRKFFDLGDDGYTQQRADEMIAEALPRIEAARENGKKGGRPKGLDKKPNGFAKGTEQETGNGIPDKASQSHIPEFTTFTSEANASGGKPPAEMNREELWKAGKSLLEQDGLAKAQCGSFVGALVKQYGEAIVIDAVRSTVLHGAADAREYLKATCMRLAGERKDPPKPITVASDAAERTAQMLAEQARHAAEAVSGEAVSSMVAGIKAKLAGSKEAAA